MLRPRGPNKILRGLELAMDVQRYRERKLKLLADQPVFREHCSECRQPNFSCYCVHIIKFNPNISFVILIHPIEVRRRIATGRMSHLCLENSFLIKGEDFATNEKVNALIADPDRHCMILYPGKNSMNLTAMSPEGREHFFGKHIPQKKLLTIFVIDGTWATAGKMARSKNLQALPKISFTPDKPSNFRVRKQPFAHCYSTIEAIHQTIDIIGSTRGFDTASREHDNLIKAFAAMVEFQLTYVQKKSKPRRILRKPKRSPKVFVSA
jgi:DTW domain-containing protein